MMATVIRHTQGHYEVQEMEFGRVYKWYPECVVIECDCGERLSLTGSTTVCKCGADYAALVREGSLPPSAWTTRPFTPGVTPGIAKMPGNLAEKRI